MDEKILIPKKEFEKLKADLERLSVEYNLREQAEEKLKTIKNELTERKQSEEMLRESEAKFPTADMGNMLGIIESFFASF